MPVPVLPLEILSNICEELVHKQDLLALRLVNSRFSALASPFAFRNISQAFTIIDNTQDFIALQDSPFAEYVHDLRIGWGNDHSKGYDHFFIDRGLESSHC